MTSRPSTSIAWLRRALAAGLLAAAAVACTERDVVRVRLQSRVPPGSADPRRLELRALVAGRLEGLRYRWYSVAGANSPQVSEVPTSTFTFADGSVRDRVAVEVWRGEEQVARAELDVTLDPTRRGDATRAGVETRIEVTLVPPYEQGGPDTRANIAGRVTGVIDSTHGVVLYARASDVWYIQPSLGTRLRIEPDGSWRSWTHTGTSYAAFLVRPGGILLPVYDVLPQVGDFVAARTIVEGARPNGPAPRR